MHALFAFNSLRIHCAVPVKGCWRRLPGSSPLHIHQHSSREMRRFQARAIALDLTKYTCGDNHTLHFKLVRAAVFIYLAPLQPGPARSEHTKKKH